MKRILVTNSGGLAPALNAFYHQMALQGRRLGFEVWAIKDATDGLASNEPEFTQLLPETTIHYARRPGSVFGTAKSGVSPTKSLERLENFICNITGQSPYSPGKFDYIITEGGDGTPKILEGIRAAAAGRLDEIQFIYAGKTIDGGALRGDNVIGAKTAAAYVTQELLNACNLDTQYQVSLFQVMGRDTSYLLMNAAECQGIFGIIPAKRHYDIRTFVAALVIQQALGIRPGATIAISEGAWKLDNTEHVIGYKEGDNAKIYGDITGDVIKPALVAEMKKFPLLNGYNNAKTPLKVTLDHLTRVQQVAQVIESDMRLAGRIAQRILLDIVGDSAANRYYFERNGEIIGALIADVQQDFETANEIGGYVSKEDRRQLHMQGVLLGDEGPLLAAFAAAQANPKLRELLLEKFPLTPIDPKKPHVTLLDIEQKYLLHGILNRTPELIIAEDQFYLDLLQANIPLTEFKARRAAILSPTNNAFTAANDTNNGHNNGHLNATAQMNAVP